MPEILPPFQGSVREGATPFEGAVREGSWRAEAEPPRPPRLPELAQGPPPPAGAAPVAPISQADIARHESDAAATPNIDPGAVKEEATHRILTQHSATLDPSDKRVTRRINPDTGSDRVTGQYFVPGDPAHERLLEDTSDYDRDKLPLLQEAMARGGPFSFLYKSAAEEEPEGEEARPTAESRAREYAASTAEQRAEGEHEGQLQRVTMIPQQFNVTKPSRKKPRRILVEGFGNDSALNNSQHLFNAANSVGRPIPYKDLGFDFQRDIAGYMQNQQHGYRGDGQGPMIEANNVPNQRFLDEQAKRPGERYVPHLLTPDRAEFLHAAMNIVPSGTTRPESQRPTFSENLQHLSRVNQGALGREGGPNKLREELDRQMPQQRRTRKNKRTGELEEYGAVQPFSKRVLESTYRAFRLDLLEHHPELLMQSLRAREGVPHEPHIITAAPIARHTGAEFKIPAWQRPQERQAGGLVTPTAEDPEVGAPIGEGQVTAYRGGGFDPSAMGEGVSWFAGEPEVAEHYAARSAQESGEAPNVGTYGLSINKPFDASQPVTKPFLGRFRKAWNEDRKERGIKELGKDWEDRVMKDYKAGLPRNRELGLDDSIFNSRGVITGGKDLILRKVLKRMGHDAISYHGPDPIKHPVTGESYRKPYQQYGVFDAHQVTPISENPEMGAPIGEGYQEGGVVESAPTQPPEPDHENNAQTFEAVSPSIRTDQTYRGARGALNRAPHQAFRDYNNRLETALAQRYGYNQASSADTIGDWSDGAENTIANESEGQDYQNRRVATALKGLHSAQKQALLFRHHDEGAPPHSLYRLRFNTDKDEDVRKLLDEHGIGMRTLYPSKGKGQAVEVHVADLSPEGDHWNAIEKLIKSGHITDAWHHKGTGELIGTEGENRYNAATEYRRILEEARERWRQARAGGPEDQGNQPGGDQASQEPWFEPFAQEAEANFEKLRASQEYKNQARTLSLKSAAEHRSQISLERERELAQNKQKAQEWVSQNPESNPLSAHHFLDKHEEFPENVEKNEHVGEFFNARNEKLDYSKADDRTKAADALVHDIMHEVSRNSSAVGWYSETVHKAFDKLSEIAPEIKTDRASNLAFRLALAITSQGQNVFDNSESAWRVYQYWKQHGEFPTENAKDIFGGGIKAPQMEFNFAKANRLWGEHDGDPEKFENWLNQTIRHGDLQKKYGVKIGSTLANAEVPMSAVFGPKIGVFFANLSGNEDPTTIDLWLSRNMNRLAGDMFGFSPTALREDRGKEKSQLNTLRDLLDNGQIEGVGEKDQAKMRKEIGRLMATKNLDRDRAMKLAPTLRDWAEKQHNFFAETIQGSDDKTRGYHPDRKTTENQNAKNIDENFKALQADPRNGTERENWNKIFDEVREKTQHAGVHLTNADRQALLWFTEQRLFQGVTGSRETSHDYLDAMHHLVSKVREGSI